MTDLPAQAPLKRGRKPLGERARTPAEQKRAERLTETEARNADIAVLDFETDKFDRDTDAVVFPFLAVLYTRHMPTVVIWEEDHDRFIENVIDAILSLPRKFTVYAHNGGKFDFMFLVHKLRGEIMFKGRGIMSAKIGNHDLRDSFHIIPEKLASYKKDDFDYSLLDPQRRNKHRAAIITYCTNDCAYAWDIISTFVNKYGRKLSIGQAAASAVKSSGVQVERLNDSFDAYLRNFYFGGRVECLAGIGHFVSTPGAEYKLYDVNSMYPTAMRDFQHPIGGQNDYTFRTSAPGPHTVFVDLTCDNYGALVNRGPDGETSARTARGRFFTTIWEHDAALELGLIDNIVYHNVVDCHKRSDFSGFVVPTYEARQVAKAELKRLKAMGLDENDDNYADVKKDDMFLKFLLNNAYGKFAQNPRRFRESYITSLHDRPDDGPMVCAGITSRDEHGKPDDRCGEALDLNMAREGWIECPSCGCKRPTYGLLPIHENHEYGYAIWERPQKRLAFNNVGTAASITGAARAILMRGIANAKGAIYCDTDSIICEDLSGVPLSPTELGAWDIEDLYSEVIIAGKKLYACDLGSHVKPEKRFKYRMKGGDGAVWADYQAMLDGAIFQAKAKGPTMTKRRDYFYMERKVRATGPAVGNERLFERRQAQ